jgi:hypothetical protein
MTAGDIIAFAADRLVKKSIDPNDGIGWLNDALTDLGIDAFRFNEQAIVAVANTWVNLPADCLKVYEVRDSQGKDYRDWEADAARIRFADDDTFTVRYYRLPNEVVSINDTPDCPEIYHRALAYYIAYRFEARDFPGEQDTLAWLSEYQARMNSARKQLQKNTKLVNVRVVR